MSPEYLFTWRANSRLPKTMAQPVGERLFAISGGNFGDLKAATVLAEAKRPDSPLHALPNFTWDVEAAAEREWLNQSRYVLRSIEFADVKQVNPLATTSGPIKMFFHSEQRGEEGEVKEDGPYISAFRVLNEADSRQRTIDEGLSSIWGILKSLRHFPELARTLAGWRKDAQEYASDGLLARLAKEADIPAKRAKKGKKKPGKKRKK
jgi:hypothetical protein